MGRVCVCVVHVFGYMSGTTCLCGPDVSGDSGWATLQFLCMSDVHCIIACLTVNVAAPLGASCLEADWLCVGMSWGWAQFCQFEDMGVMWQRLCAYYGESIPVNLQV
jgi:hypothetical protein